MKRKLDVFDKLLTWTLVVGILFTCSFGLGYHAGRYDADPHHGKHLIYKGATKSTSKGQFAPRATYLGFTTAVSAITGAPKWGDIVYVASVQGITSPGNPISTSEIGDPNDTNPSFTLLMVDQEAMQVLGVYPNPNPFASQSLFVNRGYLATAAVAHAAGSTVYYGPPSDFCWGYTTTC